MRIKVLFFKSPNLMLKKLVLNDFRNYADLRLDFAEPTGLTYMIGDNGQGKTNILEAIYMLALAKSFRSADEGNLIKWDAEFGRIQGYFEGNESPNREMEIFLGRPPQPKKIFKVNQVKSSAVNFVGLTRVVFFHPEDLNVLYLGPDLRRRYLDIMILQKSRAYFAALRAYKRVRAQRNALLTAIKDRRASESDLEVWDNQLVKEGSLIWKMRAETIQYIDQELSAKYMEISGRGAELHVEFKNSLGLDFPTISTAQNIEELYRNELQMVRKREILSEHTLIGPHRDDMDIFLNGRALLTHASRGEFRTTFLAMKLIEMEYFSRDGKRPLLLLDDVFSELDHERQRFLLEKVVHYQTFITTTKDSVNINRERLLAGNFVEIKHGKALK